MATVPTQFALAEIFASLSEIPYQHRDRSEALKKITELGKQALVSDAFTLTFVNFEEGFVTAEACTGPSKEFEDRMVGEKIPLGPPRDGRYLDPAQLAKGVILEWYGLQQDGQGVANPKTAQRFNLSSLLAYPLKLNDRLLGYVNHFSSKSDLFTSQEKDLLARFAHQAEITIERFEEHWTLVRSLRALNSLSQSLLSLSPDDFWEHVSARACELLAVPTYVAWRFDEEEQKLKIVAASDDVDTAYRRIKLDRDDPNIKPRLDSKRVEFLADVTAPGAHYTHPLEAKKRRWVSLMTAPMYVGDRLIGMLDTYTKGPRYFKDWERELLGAFASQAAAYAQKAELLRASEVAAHRQHILGGASGAPDEASMESELKETLNLVARECAAVTDATKCCLRLWNIGTGCLEPVALYDSSNAHLVICRGPQTAATKGNEPSAAVQNESPCICVDASRDFESGVPGKTWSALSVPIRSADTVIGEVRVAGNWKNAFEPDKKQALQGVVETVSLAIERANLKDSLVRLARVSTQSDSLDTLLFEVVQLTRDLMREPVCLVWLLDKDRNGFAVRASTAPKNQEKAIQSLFIRNDAIADFLARGEPLYRGDAAQSPSHPLREMVEELGWKSSLATPLLFEDRAIGILEVYSHGGERNFTSWHRRLFRTLAFQIASAIEGWSNRRRLDELNKILRQMTEARNRAELLESALEGALRLAGSGRGWISLLDLGSGRLDIAVQKGAPRSLPSLTLGKGISGKALQDNHTIRTSDVVNGEFRNLYQEFCKDTRSELAVPIVSADIEIRLGRGTSLGPKPIGVLNVESPTAGAFSKGDEDCVESIAREAAIIMDRLEFEHKYSAVSRIESEIVRRPDWPGVLETLSKGILTALGFTYVNISIVVPETNFIRTEYVIGIPGAEVQEFKAMANHSLDSQDIQADIVRSRHVEVLDKQDSRCDPLIYQRFGHDRLIRVFVPMIGPSDDRVIGTVEAGYEKGYRKYIYERDVQILKGLVDYAASVLEQRKGALFDKMMHEFRAPIAGIRHDASFLKRRIKELSDDLVERKFDDILTNTWLVLNEIAELEYRLSGQVSPASKVERTLVVRDIIIKTVNEMRPVVHAHGLDASKIHYRNEDIGKILIYVNRAKLNQVVSNILMNSIKYAEKEPQKFAIRISVDETAEHFFIKFKDWGIGIRQDLVERVFEKGFRGPEAQARFVTGSGLGLPIARETMREIGGDLRLVANYKPCEFDIVLPRTLKRGGE